MSRPLVFALSSSRDLGTDVACRLDLELSEVEEREFEFGHHKARPMCDVRGRDVYVVQSLHGDFEQSVNDKLCRLLFFLGAMRDNGAARITAVAPFLCYTRKDRVTKLHDPVTTRYVAELFEAVGIDCMVTVEVHNLAAFQNAFRCRTAHLESDAPFLDYFEPLVRGDSIAVVSPDVGGVKRASRFRDALADRLERSIGGAFLEKWRSQGVVGGEALVGDVRDRTVILFDDMISRGTTIDRAARACRQAGAAKVFVAAAHGVFTPDASPVLADAPIDTIAVLGHVPPFALDRSLVESKLAVVDVSELLADAIRTLHETSPARPFVAEEH
jgi:ribose-phosphate pyrophosphokinase